MVLINNTFSSFFKKTHLFILLNCFLLSGSKAQVNNKSLIYEFRGVWVATVINLDWPSSKGMNVDSQKAEFIKLADMHQKNGMNALIVQVRPSADAFYNSTYELWSEYLTGVQGLAPRPYYDPLVFMIEEAHKRGMEFHAWLNPYRAVFKNGESSVSPNHITKQKPEWFLNYDGKKFFNPALQEVRDYFLSIVDDIVKRYDVDGIHIDDYFYPYPNKKSTDFLDEKFYKKMGNGLSKADWRRSNCDSIIYQIYKTINAQPRRVKFGISPFGVWRNQSQDSRGSLSKAGITNYDDLYANILLWLEKGWVDYVAPQLYWERKHHLCDYEVLLDWWNNNTYNKHLYIGHAPYREGTTTGWRDKNELPNQIKLMRSCANTQGSVYFSSKSFNNNPNGWCDSLQNNYYNNPAIVPPMPWIDNAQPPKPIITQKKKTTFYSITCTDTTKANRYAIFIGTSNTNAQLKKIVLAQDFTGFNTDDWLNDMTQKLYIATLSKGNNLSEWVEVK
jgi:uncharacterized lipoprotein YddW (UPF0748 family)